MLVENTNGATRLSSECKNKLVMLLIRIPTRISKDLHMKSRKTLFGFKAVIFQIFRYEKLLLKDFKIIFVVEYCDYFQIVIFCSLAQNTIMGSIDHAANMVAPILAGIVIDNFSSQVLTNWNHKKQLVFRLAAFLLFCGTLYRGLSRDSSFIGSIKEPRPCRQSKVWLIKDPN